MSPDTFSKVMCSDGAQCFSAFICNPVKVSGSGCHATPASESDLEGVPKIYSHFSDVFSKGSADSLPPHQEYNLKIDVNESTKPPLGPIYPLSQSEVGALHDCYVSVTHDNSVSISIYHVTFCQQTLFQDA